MHGDWHVRSSRSSLRRWCPCTDHGGHPNRRCLTSRDARHVTRPPPLCASATRPLTFDDEDPMRVHVRVDDTQLSIHAVCGTAEWMGQAAQTHHGRAAGPLRVVCDASLQKQVHPHMLRMYLDQTAPTTNPIPQQERWPCLRNRVLTTRSHCKQSAGSLIWVFMF